MGFKKQQQREPSSNIEVSGNGNGIAVMDALDICLQNQLADHCLSISQDDLANLRLASPEASACTYALMTTARMKLPLASEQDGMKLATFHKKIVAASPSSPIQTLDIRVPFAYNSHRDYTASVSALVAYASAVLGKFQIQCLQVTCETRGATISASELSQLSELSYQLAEVTFLIRCLPANSVRTFEVFCDAVPGRFCVSKQEPLRMLQTNAAVVALADCHGDSLQELVMGPACYLDAHPQFIADLLRRLSGLRVLRLGDTPVTIGVARALVGDPLPEGGPTTPVQRTPALHQELRELQVRVRSKVPALLLGEFITELVMDPINFLNDDELASMPKLRRVEGIEFILEGPCGVMVNALQRLGGFEGGVDVSIIPNDVVEQVAQGLPMPVSSASATQVHAALDALQVPTQLVGLKYVSLYADYEMSARATALTALSLACRMTDAVKIYIEFEVLSVYDETVADVAEALLDAVLGGRLPRLSSLSMPYKGGEISATRVRNRLAAAAEGLAAHCGLQSLCLMCSEWVRKV